MHKRRTKEVPPLMIRLKVTLPEPGGIETGLVRVLNLPQQIHMGRRPGSGCVETDLHEALPFLACGKFWVRRYQPPDGRAIACPGGMAPDGDKVTGYYISIVAAFMPTYTASKVLNSQA